MAIKPGYKTFTFDGENSGDYGVYITGSAVYNAPERDVEMIKIPGRSGAFVKDNGRFENIEVTYPAGIYAESQEDFAQALSDLRNMLASRKGYVRLTDEYNPEEYRMAVYKSGLNVDPAAFQRAGEFTITFDCKPQRWLTSGESAVTIANSGDTITNPTLFEASPLLEIDGYGTIGFNGYEIELINEVMGEVLLADETSRASAGMSLALAKNIMNNGDTFVTYPSTLYWSIGLKTAKSVTISSVSDSDASVETVQAGNGYYTKIPMLGGTYGTASVLLTNDTTITGTYVASNDTTQSFTITLTTKVSYTVGTTHRYQVVRTVSGLPASLSMIYTEYPSTLGRMVGDSTVSILGHPTKVDCDLGKAYKEVNGDVVSLNAYIDLGSELPTLAVENTEFTHDNTVTDLKVIPRWWKV